LAGTRNEILSDQALERLRDGAETPDLAGTRYRLLDAGMALFLDIMIPGMLLGAIVGFATQRFGRTGVSAAAAR
jgi:hypothetical protein